MKYDHKQAYECVAQSHVSCAFYEARDDFTPQLRYSGWDFDDNKPGTTTRESPTAHENRLWSVLCEILTASESRPVLVPVKSTERKMKELLEACPYGELLSEVRSRHGNYTVQLWFFPVHKKGS